MPGFATADRFNSIMAGFAAIVCFSSVSDYIFNRRSFAMISFALHRGSILFTANKTDSAQTAKSLIIFNILNFYDHEIKIGSLIY